MIGATGDYDTSLRWRGMNFRMTEEVRLRDERVQTPRGRGAQVQVISFSNRTEPVPHSAGEQQLHTTSRTKCTFDSSKLHAGLRGFFDQPVIISLQTNHLQINFLYFLLLIIDFKYIRVHCPWKKSSDYL